MQRSLSSNGMLKQYALSAVAFLALNEGGSTVVYTDIDPDDIIGGEGAEISYDINGDGDDDFTFIVTSASGVGTYYGILFTYAIKGAVAEALNGNEFVGSIVTYAGYSGVYAPALESDEAINGDDEFAAGSASLGLSLVVSVLGFPYYSILQGNWLETDMKFIGFSINIGEDPFYGWMRISVNDIASSITIHDYAYENETTKTIFTGQVATDIINNPLNNTDIYSNAGNIYINFPANFTKTAGIQLFDLNGKLVKKVDQASGSNVLGCSDLPSGNYFVYLIDDELNIKKQVHLQN